MGSALVLQDVVKGKRFGAGRTNLVEDGVGSSLVLQDGGN